MKSAKFLLLLLIICSPYLSKAAAYWMEVKGLGKVNEIVHIQICYGNIDDYSIRHRDTGKELKLTGAFKLSVVDEDGKSTSLTLIQNADCWEAEFTPQKEGTYRILGVNDSHPIVDRSKIGGKNVKPVDYLCGQYQVGTRVTALKPMQLLDIVTTQMGDVVNVKAFNNGKPAVAGSKLRVFNPENWEKELTTNKNGEVVFKTTMKGLYIIREDWEDTSSGSKNGVAYTGIRHRCNYSLQVL